MPLHCSVCDREFADWMTRPIICCRVSHDDGREPSPIPDVVPFVSRAPQTVAKDQPSHWPELHRYAAERAFHGVEWDAGEATAFLADWTARIPRYGCACQANWKKYIEENPPNFNSAWKFFYWSWLAHNYVSEHHVNPSNLTISLRDATDLWMDRARPQA